MPKPKVLALGYPAYAGDEYMKEFESQYTIDVGLFLGILSSFSDNGAGA
jgi:hypothetical protein